MFKHPLHKDMKADTFLLQERLEIVCTFRQKYCVLLPQTQLEQILTLSQVIWLCCHDHSLKNVPTSRQNLCWEMSWLWVKGIWFVATDTASKSSKVESKISDLVATNSAGRCLDFEYKHLVLLPQKQLEIVPVTRLNIWFYRCRNSLKMSRCLVKISSFVSTNTAGKMSRHLHFWFS